MAVATIVVTFVLRIDLFTNSFVSFVLIVVMIEKMPLPWLVLPFGQTPPGATRRPWSMRGRPTSAGPVPQRLLQRMLRYTALFQGSLWGSFKGFGIPYCFRVEIRQVQS